MNDDNEFRVTYIGPARDAASVAQSLAESGFDPVWTPPVQTRSFQTMAEGVVVYYFCKGTDAAVQATVSRIRERLRDRATVEVDNLGGRPKRRPHE